MEPEYVVEPPRRAPVLSRLTAERGAAIVLWLGAALIVVSIVAGVLQAFRSGPFGFFGDTQDISALDRFQVFVQTALANIAFSALVLAAGVALHLWATRPAPPPVASPPPEPEHLPELERSPVVMPPREPSPIPLVPADDDFWRR